MGWPSSKPGDAQSEADHAVELTDDERKVLAVLQEAHGPMDTIDVASATRLKVDDALAALQSLQKKGLAEHVDPEPIRERYTLDKKALQALG
jgi:predicted ArsR family transcriptional regulator